MLSNLYKNWRFLFAAPFFLGALETAFIKFNGINILSSEALLAYLVLFIFGIIFGIILVFCGELPRLFLAASLLVILLLSQSPDYYQVVPIRPIYLILFLAPLLYLIRAHLDKFFLVLFGVFFVGAFFTPIKPVLIITKYPHNKSLDSKLPPYVEIVLDEHVGIEGIASIEKNHDFSQELTDRYIKKGFKVYGKAYSRDLETRISFASFLNYKPLDTTREYMEYYKGRIRLNSNKHFEKLSEKGYLINVIQSTWFDLCKESEHINLKQCSTYHHFGTLPRLAGTVTSKSIYILNNALSFLFKTEARIKFRDKILTILNLPFDKEIQSFPAIATYEAFPEIRQQLHTMKNGEAYFIHLLVPHGPYVFDKQCKNSRNTQNVFQSYIKQIKCAQFLTEKILGRLISNIEDKNSIVVIHGDHGSKLLVPSIDNYKSLNSENIMQTYNTLFLVKAPFITAGYEKKSFPLDYLLYSIVSEQMNLSYKEDRQFIYLRRTAFNMGKVPISEIYQAKKTSANVALNKIRSQHQPDSL